MTKLITILLLTSVVATGCVFGTKAPVKNDEPIFQEEEIDISDWKTYRNENLGIALNLPPMSDLRDNNNSIIISDSLFGEFEPTITIIMHKKEEATNLSDWVEDKIKKENQKIIDQVGGSDQIQHIVVQDKFFEELGKNRLYTLSIFGSDHVIRRSFMEFGENILEVNYKLFPEEKKFKYEDNIKKVISGIYY